MHDMPILEVREMRVHFKVQSKSRWPWARGEALKAVEGVSFDLRAGETLGVVGESGCGKSTLARAILNLVPRTDGSLMWMGTTLASDAFEDWRTVRKDIQMIFQDP